MIGIDISKTCLEKNSKRSATRQPKKDTRCLNEISLFRFFSYARDDKAVYKIVWNIIIIIYTLQKQFSNLLNKFCTCLVIIVWGVVSSLLGWVIAWLVLGLLFIIRITFRSVLQFRGPNTHFRASAKGICNHPILLKFSQYVSFESSYLNG